MTPEAVFQPLLDGAVAFGSNWLWLLLLIPVFVVLQASSGARQAAKADDVPPPDESTRRKAWFDAYVRMLGANSVRESAQIISPPI